MTDRPAMIFHVAYRLNPEATSGSGIRPLKMRRAFENLGYEVLEISGTHPERRQRIRDLTARIREGLQVAFVYSEGPTMPTGLGEPVTSATSLRRDIAFLRFCQRSGVPVGVFYRDIYWRFPIYAENVRWPLRSVLRTLYRWDLWRYRRADLRVYLPSSRMGDSVPLLKRRQISELPPGSDLTEVQPHKNDGRTRLFYVGGLGSNYRLHESIREAAGRDDVVVTLCLREAEWQARKHEYAEVWGDNITVVHGSGTELDAYYAEADACLIAVEPIPYWDFAAPVKLFEYIGHGKPVIASVGTFAGQFVEDHGVGWQVRYGSGELTMLLEKLHRDPALLQEASERAVLVRDQHTWEARAQTVARDLTTHGHQRDS